VGMTMLRTSEPTFMMAPRKRRMIFCSWRMHVHTRAKKILRGA
jgi:hypothetical protein